MKLLNYFLVFFGGLFVAFIFYNFVIDLNVYLSQLGREVIQADVQNFWVIRYFISFLGFVIGAYSIYKVIKD